VHRRLVRGSTWLTATVAVTALSGFTFWVLAAGLEDKDVVGQATALFTSVMFVNYATNLGLPVALARYVIDDRSPTLRLYGLFTAATAASSLLVAVAYVALLSGDAKESIQSLGAAGAVLFVVVAVGFGLAVLVEVRLMALRRWGWVLGRVVLVSIGRLVLLAVRPDGDPAIWLFVAVAAPVALSGYVGLVLLRTSGHGPAWPLPLSRLAAPAVRLAGVNWVALLLAQAPQFALPVLVLREVSSDENASFYMAFGVATVVFLLPHMVGQVLLVEGGRDGADLDDQFRLALVLSTALMAVIALVTWAGSGLVTVVYGEDYADAREILPVLVGAGVFWALTSSCLARARVLEDSVSTMAITTSFAVATLVPAVVLVPEHGGGGATAAWLFGNMVAAAVALATLARRRRRHLSDPDPVALVAR
jgi:O-antigen/teichoic acid export membrane protein